MIPQWLTETINTDNTELVNTLTNVFKVSHTDAANFAKNADDFIYAYKFVNSHPAFWWRDEPNPDASWHTNNHVSKIWVETIYDNNSKKDFWALETGQHIADSYTNHYHDFRLDVDSDTLEKSYIKLAKAIDSIFDSQGNERENIEHLKSPFLTKLENIYEKAMSEIENNN